MDARKLEKLNIFLILFFGAGLLAYLLLNGGAYWKNLRYALFLNSPFASADLKENNILEVKGAPAGASAGPTLAAESLRLVIPKIEVDAAIILPQDASNKGVLAALEEGVGLYPNSAYPGEDGRAVILGHSSRASWYRGEYAYIFSLLSKLAPGDEFYITDGQTKYVFRVFSKQNLSPAATNAILAGPTQGVEVALITCYPIGSASQRTLVQAQLVAAEDL